MGKHFLDNTQIAQLIKEKKREGGQMGIHQTEEHLHCKRNNQKSEEIP